MSYRLRVFSPVTDPEVAAERFEVRVEGFTGPFDLLLSLIAKHKLEVTTLALHAVTDDFVAHLRLQGDSWDLDETTEFLVVAAILLDLKAARLLPGDSEEDEEDLALLEARDLLFARLLQYRAFKQVAATLAQRFAATGRMTARQAGLDPHLRTLLPELVMNVTPEQLAIVAARAMVARTPATVGLDHLHVPAVSVRDQAVLLVARLRRDRSCSFRSLVADADATMVIVARFLALLELYKESAVAFEQAQALGELTVRWTGPDVGAADDWGRGAGAEFDAEGTSAPDPSQAAAPARGSATGGIPHQPGGLDE